MFLWTTIAFSISIIFSNLLIQIILIIIVIGVTIDILTIKTKIKWIRKTRFLI